MQANKRSSGFQRYLDRQPPARNVEVCAAEQRFAREQYEKLRTHEAVFGETLSGYQDTPAGTRPSQHHVRADLQTNTAANEPEAQLWGAVLLQAKADYLSNVPAVKEDAAVWFAYEEDTVGGFGWVCELFHLDPSAVRRSLDSAYVAKAAA
ncbi:MAG: hypothetical protein KGL39_07205 [Patescibacteria group bacterium]|nr:hypothetical protein [Patescibacteria group bacterium]